MNSRKLVLIEYDEDGNEVEKTCLSDNEGLLKVFSHNSRYIKARYLLDKKDRDFFTNEQWKTIEYFWESPVDIYSDDSGKFAYATLNIDRANIWKNFLSESLELQSYVKSIYDYGCGSSWQWHIHPGSEPQYDERKFISCYGWVKNTSGIYYSVNNNGLRCWDFVNQKPTLKQVKYQEKKGRRIVFFNFNDFKEYSTSISDFK